MFLRNRIFSQHPPQLSTVDPQPSTLNPQGVGPWLSDLGCWQIFDLATKEYREPDQNDTMIPPEPWQPPQVRNDGNWFSVRKVRNVGIILARKHTWGDAMIPMKKVLLYPGLIVVRFPQR